MRNLNGVFDMDAMSIREEYDFRDFDRIVLPTAIDAEGNVTSFAINAESKSDPSLAIHIDQDHPLSPEDLALGADPVWHGKTKSELRIGVDVVCRADFLVVEKSRVVVPWPQFLGGKRYVVEAKEMRFGRIVFGIYCQKDGRLLDKWLKRLGFEINSSPT